MPAFLVHNSCKTAESLSTTDTHTTIFWRLHMTDTYAAHLELDAPQQVMSPMPEPLPPEDVLYLLTQQPPQGEHSVDAF